ncbi:MAG: hypothetical protein R2731_07760 [Nocardioides sp.]
MDRQQSYSATADQWRAWRDRPTGPPGEVRLVPLGVANCQAYYDLRTHHSQERFVATMPESFAHALFPEVVDGAPVVPGCSASRPTARRRRS